MFIQYKLVDDKYVFLYEGVPNKTQVHTKKNLIKTNFEYPEYLNSDENFTLIR